MTKHKRYESAFDALFEPEEAASLKARAELMHQIVKIVDKRGLTQAQAAKKSGITQPRMNALLNGHIEKFSLDSLFDIATALGRKVTIKVEAQRKAD